MEESGIERVSRAGGIDGIDGKGGNLHQIAIPQSRAALGTKLGNRQGAAVCQLTQRFAGPRAVSNSG